MDRGDGLELLAAITFYFGLTVAIPSLLLYGAGAAQEQANLTSFFTYGILGAPVIIALFIRIYLRNKDYFEDHPELAGFDLITLHSPEQTWLGQRKPLGFEIKKLMTPVNLFSIFFIISLVIGAGIGVSGQFASGVPTLVDASVSDSTALGLAVEPAVSSETLFFQVGLLFFQTAILYYVLYTRFNLSQRQSIIIGKVVSVFLTTIWFYVYHLFRYGAAETNQIGVLLLGFLLNVVTAVTASAIPAYLIHAANNFFHEAIVSGVFTSETAIVVAILGTVVSAGFLGWRIIRRIG